MPASGVGDSDPQGRARLPQPAELRAATALMAKYSDTPIDYADATLVLLAERIRVFDVLTLEGAPRLVES